MENNNKTRITLKLGLSRTEREDMSTSIRNSIVIPTSGTGANDFYPGNLGTALATEVNTLKNTINGMTIPTKVSDLDNDSGFLTQHQSLAGLATEQYVNNAIGEILGDGQISTNFDTIKEVADYLTQHGSDYTALVTAVQGKADASAIPTKVSDLTNDSGYLTEHQSLTNYATKSYVDSAVPTYMSNLNDDVGYLTTSVDYIYFDSVQSTIDITFYDFSDIYDAFNSRKLSVFLVDISELEEAEGVTKQSMLHIEAIDMDATISGSEESIITLTGLGFDKNGNPIKGVLVLSIVSGGLSYVSYTKTNLLDYNNLTNKPTISNEPEECSELEIRRMFRTEYTITLEENDVCTMEEVNPTIWSKESATVTILTKPGQESPFKENPAASDIVLKLDNIPATVVVDENAGTLTFSNPTGNIVISTGPFVGTPVVW